MSIRKQVEIGECNVPNGKSGDWKVDETVVTEKEAAFSRMRAALNPGRSWEEVEAGTYKRLCCGGTIVMSNTQMECHELRRFVEWAEGRVLVNGLGLGIALTAILKKPEVTYVRVIEKSKDVIALVGPSFLGQCLDHRLEIIEGDALTYKPARGEKYDVIWHDIWNDICGDNLAQIQLLRKRWVRRCAWQGCWSERMIRSLRY